MNSASSSNSNLEILSEEESLHIIDELRCLRKEKYELLGLWNERVERLFDISNLEFNILEGEDPTRFLNDPLFWVSYSHRKGFCRESHINDPNPQYCPLDEENISPYPYQQQEYCDKLSSDAMDLKSLHFQQPLLHLAKAQPRLPVSLYELVINNDLQRFEQYLFEEVEYIEKLLAASIAHKSSQNPSQSHLSPRPSSQNLHTNQSHTQYSQSLYQKSTLAKNHDISSQNVSPHTFTSSQFIPPPNTYKLHNTINNHPNDYTVLSYSDFITISMQLTLFQTDSEGNGLMHWIALYNNIQFYQLVLSYLYAPSTFFLFFELLNLKNIKHESPLFYAIYSGNLSMVQLLLLYGAIPFIRNTTKSSIFHIIARKGHLLLLDYLFSQYLSSSKIQSHLLKLLSSSTNSTSTTSTTSFPSDPLLASLSQPLSQFLSMPSFFSSKTSQTLQCPSVEIFSQSQQHSKRNKTFISPTDIASYLQYYPPFIKELIFYQTHQIKDTTFSSHPSMNLHPENQLTSLSNSFLHQFITKFPIITLNTIQFYSRFLSTADMFSFSLNSFDMNFKTPLHWAVYNNYPTITRWLLSHNVSVYIQDTEYCLPIHWGVIKGNHQCVEILLDHLHQLTRKQILQQLSIHAPTPTSLSSSFSSTFASSSSYTSSPGQNSIWTSPELISTPSSNDLQQPSYDKILNEIEHISSKTIQNSALLGLLQIYHQDCTKSNLLQLLQQKLASLYAENDGKDKYHYCEAKSGKCNEKTGHSWDIKTIQPKNFVDIFKYTTTYDLVTKYSILYQNSIKVYGIIAFLQHAFLQVQANFFVFLTTFLYLAHIIALYSYIIPYLEHIPFIGLFYWVITIILIISIYSWFRSMGNPGVISPNPHLDFGTSSSSSASFSYIDSIGDIQSNGGINSHYFLTNHHHQYNKQIQQNIFDFFPPSSDSNDSTLLSNTIQPDDYNQMNSNSNTINTINNVHNHSPVQFDHTTTSNQVTIPNSKSRIYGPINAIKNIIFKCNQPLKQHCVEFIPREISLYPSYSSPRGLYAVPLPVMVKNSCKLNTVYSLSDAFDRFGSKFLAANSERNSNSASNYNKDINLPTQTPPTSLFFHENDTGCDKPNESMDDAKTQTISSSMHLLANTSQRIYPTLPINSTHEILAMESNDAILSNGPTKSRQSPSFSELISPHGSINSNQYSTPYPYTTTSSSIVTNEKKAFLDKFLHFLQPSFRSEYDVHRYIANIQTSLTHASLRASFYNTIQRFTTLSQRSQNPTAFALLSQSSTTYPISFKPINNNPLGMDDSLNCSTTNCNKNLSFQPPFAHSKPFIHTILDSYIGKPDYHQINTYLHNPSHQFISDTAPTSSTSTSSTATATQLQSNPGLSHLYQQLLQSHICFTCGIERPFRSKHCRELNICIHKFDHFCLFLNNAIGAHNYRWFILWISTTLLLLSVFVIVALFTIRLIYSVDMAYVQTIIENLNDVTPTKPIIPATHTYDSITSQYQLHIFGLIEAKTLYGSLWGNLALLLYFDISFTTLLLLLCMTICVICILFNLLTLHIQLILSNLTTNEWLNKHKYTYLQLAGQQLASLRRPSSSSSSSSSLPLFDSTFINPFGYNFSRNIKSFLGLGHHDSYLLLPAIIYQDVKVSFINTVMYFTNQVSILSSFLSKCIAPPKYHQEKQEKKAKRETKTLLKKNHPFSSSSSSPPDISSPFSRSHSLDDITYPEHKEHVESSLHLTESDLDLDDAHVNSSDIDVI